LSVKVNLYNPPLLWFAHTKSAALQCHMAMQRIRSEQIFCTVMWHIAEHCRKNFILAVLTDKGMWHYSGNCQYFIKLHQYYSTKVDMIYIYLSSLHGLLINKLFGMAIEEWANSTRLGILSDV